MVEAERERLCDLYASKEEELQAMTAKGQVSHKGRIVLRLSDVLHVRAA